MKVLLAIVALCFAASAAHAENADAECWAAADDRRGDQTCANLSEKFLLNFRGQTLAFVQKAMRARGGPDIDANKLHFISMSETGGGAVLVTFEDGRVTIVSATVEPPSSQLVRFLWTAYAPVPLDGEVDRSTLNYNRPAYCSDFSGRPRKCS